VARLGGGAGDDAGFPVAEHDGEGSVGGQHGDALPSVDAGEGDLLPGDDDQAGGRGAALDAPLVQRLWAGVPAEVPGGLPDGHAGGFKY
jgi:hypothetical protein